MVALEATVDAFLPVLSASQRDAMTDSFAAKRAAAGDGEFCHVMELALTKVLIGPCHKFVWVKSPDLPALNVSRLGLVIDAAAVASHVGVGEVPVRLVPAQLSSGAWLPTMELCLNAAHFRPATQQECTDAVIEALEAGMPFEIPGGEDEDDGEGEGDDNDGAEDDLDEVDYWSGFLFPEPWYPAR
jgi:hypothetical protein